MNNSKKVLALLLALAMIFSMAACTSGGGSQGGGTDEPVLPSPSPAAAATPAPTPAETDGEPTEAEEMTARGPCKKTRKRKKDPAKPKRLAGSFFSGIT